MKKVSSIFLAVFFLFSAASAEYIDVNEVINDAIGYDIYHYTDITPGDGELVIDEILLSLNVEDYAHVQDLDGYYDAQDSYYNGLENAVVKFGDYEAISDEISAPSMDYVFGTFLFVFDFNVFNFDFSGNSDDISPLHFNISALLQDGYGYGDYYGDFKLNSYEVTVNYHYDNSTPNNNTVPEPSSLSLLLLGSLSFLGFAIRRKK